MFQDVCQHVGGQCDADFIGTLRGTLVTLLFQTETKKCKDFLILLEFYLLPDSMLAYGMVRLVPFEYICLEGVQGRRFGARRILLGEVTERGIFA